MNDKINKEMTVGALVAEDFNRAKVFEHLGIDYSATATSRWTRRARIRD